ncbi:MAG: hypothetical protein C0597_15960 [Marinilabiliales bacterium]|nr:MAG: hypothetical protein C0597_15960 [Marinilabiliales bacterium]
MFKRITFIFVFCIIGGILYSQQKVKVELKEYNQSINNKELIEKTSNGFIIKEKISAVDLIENETKEGTYRQIFSDGMSKTFDAGKPDLPVINRLIEIPKNHKAKVKLMFSEEEIVELTALGIKKLIAPAQPSVAKSKNLKDVPFHKDEKVYGKNEFYKRETIIFEDLGYLRDKHLGYIEISPFSYNPITNTIKVLSNIEVSVEFIAETEKDLKNLPRVKSSYFDDLNYQTINSTNESKALISGPIKYVVVSDRMFEETLQPFIDWKTKKGFMVVEAYTDEIGTTTTDIKAYLQNLYDNPDDGISPTFALLVGDVAQIPTFSGMAGSHKTDLYYFEYTDDKLPEVFYGRFSAESIEELQPQIDKTLEIEKYEMPDPTYLDNVVLVAGVDASYAPTYGNGAINYANDYYTNTDNGITSYYYLYGDASGVMSSSNSEASASIRSYISSGVSFTNYTAHCGSSGWSDPSFNISHIDGLTNDHMYPLIIGNCCQSNTFYNDDCFGEEILMAANKGAVGYIGGSNYTYWDEDYYWGVGLTSSITANPTYEGSGLGAYDKFFHLNGESKEDWYITQGQINVAGNIAVQASTSSRKAYYWEIYHLMGDPSLTPYVTVPESIVANYNSEIFIGSSNFLVDAEEDAYVALSQNGVLLDAQLVDETGSVELNFDPIADIGIADIVITKQNRQPIVDQVDIIPATTPYVILDYFLIDDASGNNNSLPDYGETINLDVQLKNLSNTYDAFNVSATLISLDTNIIITKNNEAFGSIARSDSSFIEESFSVTIKSNINDQKKLTLELELSGEDLGSVEYTWNSKLYLTLNAPKLEIGEFIVEDIANNNNGILDPGETCNISLIVANSGNADISNLVGLTEIIGSGNLNLTINNGESEEFDLSANETDTISFNVTANSETNVGTSVYLNFNIECADNNYYNKSESKELVIGQIPEIKITDNDTTIISKGYFYDSGGSTNIYSNSENETITIRPNEIGNYLEVEFIDFDVEPNGSGCYDYLNIYNGEDISADLIGSYCNSNLPDKIIASNPDGALTFKFYSDGSVVHQGWIAKITSKDGLSYSLTLTISGNNGYIEGAIVEFLGEIDTSDVNGNVVFYDIPEGINYPLQIAAYGYNNLNTTIDIFNNTSQEIILEELSYDITFNLFDQDGIIDGEVTFNDTTLTTNGGIVTFHNVNYDMEKEYIVHSFGCESVIDTLEVTSNITKNVILNAHKYNIAFNFSDGTNPVKDVMVEFNEKEIASDVNGLALFEQVKMDTGLIYNARKTGFSNIEGTIDVLNDSSVNLLLIEGKAKYKVCFEVQRELGPIYNAEVILNDDTLYTDYNGLVIFNDVEESDNISYKITKPHFNDEEGVLSLSGENMTFTKVLTYTSYKITYILNSDGNPVDNAIINFNEESKSTDSNGESYFNLIYSLNRTYQINKEGFEEIKGMINVDKDQSIELEMTKLKYDVTFIVQDLNSVFLDGVLVEFNGSSQYTDSNGESLFSDITPENDMSFTLSKDGFWNYDSSISVINQDTVFTIKMASTTIITNLDQENIKIYPNPSNGLFSIEIKGVSNETFTIKVFNVIGSIVYNNKLTGESIIKEQVDISDNAKGMYFISIESDDGSVLSKRILIK